MLIELNSQQTIANALKYTIDHLTPRRGENQMHKRTLKTINHFEAVQWIPRLFEDLCREQEFGGLAVEGQRVTYEPPSNDLIETCRAVQTLLLAYMRAVLPDPMDSEDAAVYLGIPLPTLKYLVHRKESLKSRKVGHSLIFTKADLDSVEVNRREASTWPE